MENNFSGKKTISIIIFIVLNIYSFPKNPQEDSLKDNEEYLLQIKYDTSSVSNLLNKANDLFYENPELAKKYTQKAIYVSDSLKYQQGMAKAYFLQGQILYNSYQYKQAANHLIKALQFYENKDTSTKLLNLYHFISTSYYLINFYNKALLYSEKGYDISKALNKPNEQISFLITNSICHDAFGEYTKALEELYTAVDLAERNNIRNRKAEVFLSIGMIYDRQNDHDKAIRTYNEALDVFTELGDSTGISSANNNLGTTFSSQGKYEKAFLYFFEALQIDIELGDNYGIAIEYNNIGDTYREISNFGLAKEYYSKSLELSRELNENDLISTLYYNLALVYDEQNKFEESLDYALKSLEIARHINNAENILDALELSSRIYSNIGEFRLAYNYSNEYHDIYDSLLNKTKAREIIDLQARYENKQKEQKIQKLIEKGKYQQTIKKYLSIIILIGVLLFILLIILFYIQQSSAKKIRKQKDYFDTLLKHSQDFIAVLDKDAHILYLSPSYEQKFGRTVNERMFQSAYEYIHPDDISVLESNINEIQNSKQSIAFEFRIKDASENWVSMAAHGMNLLNNKNINGIIINFWDITKRKEYEDELEKTNETKNKLFSIIGHDLRGLVGAGKSVIDYILEEKDGITKDEIFELLIPTQKSNESLVLLLDNLLTWAKSQLETISYLPKNYRLLPLINENIKIFQRVAEEKSISFNIKGDTDVKAYFDKEQVNFIIRNLMQNAIKYSYKNSDISIELKSINGFIQCGVLDKGTGMEKERQLSLFQNSFPVSMPGTNSEKGSGLGLMLCKDFIKNNNGNIWVESTSGEGSSFYFTLPVKPTSHAV
ncbi:MAG: hypothetical protein B6D61_02840 [Bacteroidetes bacterium 4484_249]|nr:MAG: hypothetical protein B6D61_02840 [Bacteroidetes bacterium 4484_249]